VVEPSSTLLDLLNKETHVVLLFAVHTNKNGCRLKHTLTDNARTHPHHSAAYISQCEAGCHIAREQLHSGLQVLARLLQAPLLAEQLPQGAVGRCQQVLGVVCIQIIPMGHWSAAAAAVCIAGGAICSSSTCGHSTHGCVIV
jgi:hypothetical protein